MSAVIGSLSRHAPPRRRELGSAEFSYPSGSADAQEELAELRPLDMGAYAEFGSAIALQGDMVVIGAPGENARGGPPGRAELRREAAHSGRPAKGLDPAQESQESRS